MGNSFKAIGTGFLLFIAGTGVLWWNEGRAVKTEKMLNDAEKACVAMENPSKIDRTLDGELVCATAVATTTDSLVDSQYGIGANAIALLRNAEYYQWVEHSHTTKEEKMGGKEVETTTYTYSQEWVKKPVKSGQFHDPDYQQKNHVMTTVEDQEQWAENVSFGAYRLNETLIHSISSTEPLDLNFSEERLQQMNAPYNSNAYSSTTYVHQNGNELYYGSNPGSPQIGDVRVTFKQIVPAKVTIIAQVDNDTFKAFKASNGKTFQTLVMGQKTQEEIFEDEHATNTLWTWVLRIGGIALVIAGLKNIFNFLQTLLKVVPFIANIVGFGVGLVCSVVGTAWSLIIIALAWLFYRPVLGISLLVVAGFLVWVFAFKGKDKLKQLAQSRKQPEPVQEEEVPANPVAQE